MSSDDFFRDERPNQMLQQTLSFGGPVVAAVDSVRAPHSLHALGVFEYHCSSER
jgi:hypothetical protein